jgi:serine/threonine protein kinase
MSSAGGSKTFVARLMQAWDAERRASSDRQEQSGAPVYTFWPGDDVIFTVMPPASIPTRLTFVKDVGKGNFGTVYAAYAEPSLLPLAVKQCSVRQGKDAEYRSLAREVLVGLHGGHRNVMRVDVAFTRHDRLYIACEWCPRGLNKAVDDRRSRDLPFSEPEIRWVMQQLLEGLCYLHGSGILHRDLKSANLLLDRTPPQLAPADAAADAAAAITAGAAARAALAVATATAIGGVAAVGPLPASCSLWSHLPRPPLGGAIVKIADFGLARQTAAAAAEELAAAPAARMTTVGSPLHMAPEVLAAAARYTEKVDLYSVGTILFLLVTGKRSHLYSSSRHAALTRLCSCCLFLPVP